VPTDLAFGGAKQPLGSATVLQTLANGLKPCLRMADSLKYLPFHLPKHGGNTSYERQIGRTSGQ
jgi:hypothetical protein